MDPSVTQPSSRYIREFEGLFLPIREDVLCDGARNGKLRHCQFRSLCWRYFLNCLPKNRDQWLENCSRRRRQYDTIKARHLVAKEHNDQNSASPSATTTDCQKAHIGEKATDSKKQSAGNVKSPGAENMGQQERLKRSNKEQLDDEQQYIRATNQCDHRNVFRTIERDVVRTFPEMEFFRQSEMQAILENVLFNYASENPHLSYKQGMHELLATLLYVLHTDSHNCLINNEGGLANETIATLLDLKYLEHDVFHLFCALMQSIETWYQNDEILVVPDDQPSRAGESSINKSSSSVQRQQVGSVLGNKLRMISENIVRNNDLELFNHLEALQIAPQIYGIRWMRLLFGREFEFLDLLTVWDALICDRDTMSLTDYIFASMLLTIREKLVNGDYTECLNSLMRHQFKDTQFVIKLALHLREPHNYPKPKAYQIRPQPAHHHLLSTQRQQKNRFSTESAMLATKLSQQYLNVKQQFQQQVSGRTRSPTMSSLNMRSQPAAVSSSSRSGQKSYASNSGGSSSRTKSLSSSGQRRTSFDQGFTMINPIREYEMREMQSTSSSSTSNQPRGNFASTRPQLANFVGAGGANLSPNVSTESYDDLHSIVDYCWRLLSDQIDSLQRCLPKEKSLDSEDEIFVALAQLKKVRDVLKGSLRLEDELETLPTVQRSSQQI